MREYTKEQCATVWLNLIIGIISPKLNRLLEIAKAQHLIANHSQYRAEIIRICGEDIYSKMCHPISKPFVTRLFDDMRNKRVGILIKEDEDYPQSLLEIGCPPSVLYYKGDVSLLKGTILGLVGSREPSRYGQETTAEFATILSRSGLTIASGLARGVDSIAHRAALDNDGKTIAVLGCGIDRIYPQDNQHLFKMIEERGLIISEYGLGKAASSYHFPERNRIISGISQGVLVTEAGQKSGSLITANFAIEQSKELFVVPSAIRSKKGEGSNNLIKKLQGTIVLSPDDVLERLGLQAEKIETSAMQLDFTEEKILKALSYGELHFEELAKVTGLGVQTLSSLLTKMEILNIIKKLDNNFYGV